MLAKTPLPSQAPRQNVVSLRQVSKWLHLRRHYLSPMSGGHWGLTLYNSLFQLGFAGTCCLSRQPCALSLWACRPQRPALLLCGPLSAGGPGWNAPTVRRSGASGKEKGWMPSPTPDCFPMEWVVLVTFLRASCGWEGTLWRGWSRTTCGGLGPCTHSQLAAPSWSQAGFPPALEPSPEQRLSLVQRSLSPPPPCVPAASQPKYGPTSEAQPPPRILWEDSARWSGTGHTTRHVVLKGKPGLTARSSRTSREGSVQNSATLSRDCSWQTIGEHSGPRAVPVFSGAAWKPRAFPTVWKGGWRLGPVGLASALSKVSVWLVEAWAVTWSVVPGPPVSTEMGSEYVSLPWRSRTWCWGGSCPQSQSSRGTRRPGPGAGAVSLKRLHKCAELRPRLTATNSWLANAKEDTGFHLCHLGQWQVPTARENSRVPFGTLAPSWRKRSGLFR